MRTLLIGYDGDDSGHGRYCRAILSGLQQIGEDASLHSVNAMPRRARQQPAPVRYLDRTVRTLANAVASARAIRARDPDVVHFQLLTPLIDRWWIPHLALHRVRVLTVHNVQPHEKSPAYPRSLLSSVFGSMDALIVHSDSNRAALSRMFPALEKRISVVPHGTWNVGAVPGRAVAREALGLSPDGPVILFFGAIRRNKGLALLLEAASVLPGSLSNATVLIAGQPDRDGFGPYAALLDRLTPKPRVSLHLGRIPEDRVALFYAAADIVALPYDDTFMAQSGVLMDAYAYRVPVLATDVGSIGDTVSQDHTGVVVKQRDAAELARGAAQLLHDPPAREGMRARMEALSRTTYSWARIAALTRDVYLRAGSERNSSWQGKNHHVRA